MRRGHQRGAQFAAEGGDAVVAALDRRLATGPRGQLEVPEHCDGAGAARLARRIEAYWAERGHHVHCEIRAGGGRHTGVVWGVRSDLVAGLPRRG